MNQVITFENRNLSATGFDIDNFRRLTEVVTIDSAKQARSNPVTYFTDCASCTILPEEFDVPQKIDSFYSKMLLALGEVITSRRATHALELLLQSKERHELEEITDLDGWIHTAPPRLSGKIKVNLRYRGRSNYIPRDIDNDSD